MLTSAYSCIMTFNRVPGYPPGKRSTVSSAQINISTAKCFYQLLCHCFNQFYVFTYLIRSSTNDSCNAKKHAQITQLKDENLRPSQYKPIPFVLFLFFYNRYLLAFYFKYSNVYYLFYIIECVLSLHFHSSISISLLHIQLFCHCASINIMYILDPYQDSDIKLRVWRRVEKRHIFCFNKMSNYCSI